MATAAQPRGSVAELRRWPVKSMGGEPLESAAAAAGGLEGDRRYAVWPRADGDAPLRAVATPALLAWSAGCPGSGPVVLTAPSGAAYAADDPDLPAALAESLGRPVELRRARDSFQDVPGTLHVTVEASRRAAEAELGRPLDLRRFRANLHLDLDAPAWAEDDWTGATIAVEGGPALRVVEPCIRCVIPTRNPDTRAKWPQLARWLVRQHANVFGFRARVLQPGRLERGAAVTVRPAS